MSMSSKYWASHPAEAATVDNVFRKAYDGANEPHDVLSQVTTAAQLGILDRGHREDLWARVVERVKQLDQRPFTSGDRSLAVELEPLAKAISILDS